MILYFILFAFYYITLSFLLPHDVHESAALAVEIPSECLFVCLTKGQNLYFDTYETVFSLYCGR